MIRCYNCGLQGHLTQYCPSYGWYFPAPGKTRDDYVDLKERVANIFAADIIREHEPDETASEGFNDRRPSQSTRELAYPCTGCGAATGVKCTTRSGRVANHVHRERREAAALDALGAPGLE